VPFRLNLPGPGPLVLRRSLAAALFVPTDIAGCKAWYDFSDITSLWEAASLTDQVDVDGDSIVSVTDKSGAANHLAVSIVFNTPLYKTGIINGLSVARFDGSNDQLTSPVIATDASWTMFLLAQKRSAPGAGVQTLFSGAGNVNVVTASATDANGYVWAVNEASSLVALGGTATGVNIVCIRVASVSNLIARINGGSGTTLDPADAAATASLTYAFGSDGTLPGDFDLGEVLAYDSALSDADLDAIGNYLATKWGATWTTVAGTNAIVTPATVVAVGAVPAPTVQAAAVVAPATVAAVAAVPAPTIRGAAIVAPATVVAVASVPAPTVRGAAIVAPVTVAAVASVPAPTILVSRRGLVTAAVLPLGRPEAGRLGSRILGVRKVVGNASVAPATVVAVASVPAPTVQATALVAPATVVAVAAVPAPTVAAAARVTPATVVATASVPAPTVSGTAIVQPVTVAAIAQVPAPSILTGGSVSVAPATVVAIASVPGPTVQGTARVTPATVVAVASVPGPTVLAAARVTPATVVAVALVPAPTIRGTAVVAPATVVAFAAVPGPSIVITGGVVVSPVTVVARVVIPAPTIEAISVTAIRRVPRWAKQRNFYGGVR
jgi:hypothetical protein